jgi:exopolysaccharide production protein ExoQ
MRAEPRSRRAQSGRSGSRALIAFLALLIVLPLLFSTVDIDSLSGPVRAPVGAAAGAGVAPNPLTRAVKISLILFGALVILSHMREARALLRRANPFYLAFLALALLSVAWSADQGATIARYISTISFVFASFAFCLAGWHRQRLQNVIRPVLTVLVALSLIYTAAVPELALDPDKAGYHGLSGQKNPYGWQCAICALLWMHAWISGEAKIWKAIPGAALGWTGLLLSKSSTSILATAFASWLMFMLLRNSPALRRYTPYMVGVFACLVVAYALAVLQIVPGLSTILLGPIMAITGKDMTFSNRATIWEIVKEHAQFHPLLGTGFGAYWTGPVPSSPSYVFLGRMYFWPSEAHNGYLDVYNDLGIVGLLCLLGYLTVFVRQSLRLFKTDRVQGTFYLGLFFQQAMNNLSESLWFSPMGPLPALIVTIATFSLARSLWDQQQLRALQRRQMQSSPARQQAW